ncbi:MAG: GNAT family N-acetyltransferase [Acidimicrobiia bacterium]|nr:GNAT family N-acetyltransferase [Acidimicrobiia bacterium]
MTTIRRAMLTDHRRVLDTLVDAFYADPVHAWIFEDEAVRTSQLPHWFTNLLHMVPDGGHVDVADDLTSAAIWHPPLPPPEAGDEPPDELPPIAQQLLDALGPDAGMDKLVKLAPMMDLHPHEPHWYLAVVGTAASARGKGLGGDLIRHQLDVCDATAMPAYLESSNPRNVGLYHRHGFEVFETVELDDGGPEVSFMWREPVSS